MNLKGAGQRKCQGCPPLRQAHSTWIPATTVSQTTATDPDPQGHCGDSPSGPGPIVTTSAKASDNPIIINR